MKLKKTKYIGSIVAITMFIFSCSKDDDTTPSTSQTSSIPAVYSKIYGATSITSDGTFITFNTIPFPKLTP